MISTRSRLALAIRRTNVAFGALPKETRDRIEIGSIVRLEAAIDTALTAGDELWEREALRVFEEAGQ